MVSFSSLPDTTACRLASSTNTSATASASSSTSLAMSSLAPAVAPRMSATPTAQSASSLTHTRASAGSVKRRLLTMSSAPVPPGEAPLLRLYSFIIAVVACRADHPFHVPNNPLHLHHSSDAMRALLSSAHLGERCASQGDSKTFLMAQAHVVIALVLNCSTRLKVLTLTGLPRSAESAVLMSPSVCRTTVQSAPDTAEVGLLC